MSRVFFVSDLHGKTIKYNKLFGELLREPPDLLFIGGDLLPHAMLSRNPFDPTHQDFINNYLVPGFARVRDELGDSYPEVFVILGNDDPRFEEAALIGGGEGGLWEYLHDRNIRWREYRFFGYSCIPPSPFLLKDWEKFDVSRYVDPGSVSPLEGYRTFPVSLERLEYETIQKDLEGALRGDLGQAVLLFHVPPYGTNLDLADLEGRMIDYVPLDPHIGSYAVKRLIEEREPRVTLHGHAHESTRLTGRWSERTGRTYSFSAACEGEALAIIDFELEDPASARRREI